MKKLIEYLNSIYPLSPPLRAHLYNTVKVTDIKKRKMLIRPGQVCDRMYFIEWGLLRGSKIRDGRESSLWFMKEQDIMTSVVSYYNAVDSTETIYAMEDSRLYSITKQQLDHINHQWLEFNFIVRVLTEKYYVLDEEKLDMLRIKKAADRYDRFLQLYPGLQDRIAGKYIASYLGITLETLSRIKNKR
jgi:CRP/FNR family transcriptional regulator, anaerobic regulatory protein